MPEMNNIENPQMREIAELERQLAEKKAQLNYESAPVQTENRVELTRENAPFETQPVAAPVAPPTTAKPDNKQREVEADARNIATMDEAHKIETLVVIALEKGIMHCIAVATKLQDPYILDTLHDKLIGELHERLVNENKLKEI